MMLRGAVEERSGARKKSPDGSVRWLRARDASKALAVKTRMMKGEKAET
jgi:hypothetical protein